MLLLFFILLSESIMTVMFLLHQHSAVQQIQVKQDQQDQCFQSVSVQSVQSAAFLLCIPLLHHAL